ncbi:delta(14)-sterol reductase-like [Phragmites australis]|uniref:delta(14)-sterol reductase-like n=1 Tax=Phragmites australis TaxID=29695 RepID=UPI002D775C05|nr:delta(14)-sterol reductase-like [Phragmites australis]
MGTAAAVLDLVALVPSWSAVVVLLAYLGYLADAGALLPGKLVAGAVLPDSSRLHYRCNGLLSLLLLLGLIAMGVYMEWMSPTVVADRGLELLSATFIFSVLVSFALYFAGLKSRHKSSSLKPHVSGSFIQDWWLGVQLNPHFMGVDLKFFFVRAGMMAWLFINLSLFAKSYLADSVNLSVILYQFFCAWYIIDYFVHEEFMTSTWDIIAERLGFMLVFGDLVFIPFTFTLQGWWLLRNKVELPLLASVANCFIFLIGYLVFRGANKQKHVFKKDPKALIWGKPPKVVGGKLLASGYWGIARHCNYLGDLLLALSFSLPCGASSVIPYFYPTYLLILLIWRERRDEARCSQKYKDIWAEYCKLVPWRILPYVY